MSRMVRIYADRDGESHVEERRLSVVNPPTRGAAGAMIPTTSRPVLRSYPEPAPDADWAVVDWHRVPGKTFVVAISGSIEVEVSDGTRMAIGTGDLVYLEDISGRGHVTRLRGSVTNLFLPVGPDFDVLAWLDAGGVPDVPGPG